MKARSTLKYVGVALFELILLVCAVQHVAPTTVETGGVRFGLANGCILYMGAVENDACVLHGWQRVAQRQMVRDFAVQNDWPLPAGDFPFWGLFAEQRSSEERDMTYFGLPLWIPLAVMVGVVGILFRNDRRGVLAGPFHYYLARVLGRLIFRCVRAFCCHRFWDRSHDSRAKRFVRIAGPVSCLLMVLIWILSTQYAVRCGACGLQVGFDGGAVIVGRSGGSGVFGGELRRGSPHRYDAIDWPIHCYSRGTKTRIWFILLVLTVPTVLACRSDIADMIVGRRRRTKAGRVVFVTKWLSLSAGIPVMILWNLTYNYDIRYQWSDLDPPKIFDVGTDFGGVYFGRTAIQISNKGLRQLRQTDWWSGNALFEPAGWSAEEVYIGMSSVRFYPPVLPCVSRGTPLPNPCLPPRTCDHGTNCKIRNASFTYGAAWLPFWPVLTVFLAIGLVLFWRDRRLPLGCCQWCAYDLTGNVSGTCPECGQPIPQGFAVKSS